MDFSEQFDQYEISEINSIAQEIDFYLRGIRVVKNWKEKGFPVTYGSFDENMDMEDIYELGLAESCLNVSEITANSVHIPADKKGILVTGFNQGGKTTYLRAIGQSIYFTLIGFPAIGTKIVIPWTSGIFTHFTIEETAAVSNGKLVEELNHIKEIKEMSAEGAVILLNEMFSSTTVYDAQELSERFINSCLEKDQFVYCVTHIPELTDAIPCLERYKTHQNMSYKIESGTEWNNNKANEIMRRHHLLAEDIRRQIHG